MASAKQHQLNTLLDRRGPGTFNEETGTWIESGWQFFGLIKSNTVENAEDHLRDWGAAIVKKDKKAAEKEHKWFNDNDWAALETSGSPPFYSRMVWKSDKLKKKIGITITGNSYNLDVPSNI